MPDEGGTRLSRMRRKSLSAALRRTRGDASFRTVPCLGEIYQHSILVSFGSNKTNGNCTTKPAEANAQRDRGMNAEYRSSSPCSPPRRVHRNALPEAVEVLLSHWSARLLQVHPQFPGHLPAL